MLDEDTRKFQDLWHLQAPRKLASTHSSDVYRVEYFAKPAVLKIVKPSSDEHQSAEILRYFAGKGAVQLFQSQNNGLLLEYLEPAPLLKAMVADDRDDEAAKIIAAVINELHAPRSIPFPQGTKTLEHHFHALFQKAGAEPSSIYAKAAQLARKLLADESEIRVLHGDVHHENILHSDRGWLAIDPKGIIGERTYEVANTLCNPYGLANIVHSAERMQRQADILATALSMDKERILAFAFVHSCLSVCWAMEDDQDFDYAMKCSAVLATLV